MNTVELSPLDRLKAVWADLPYSYREFLKYLIAVWKHCRKVFPCLFTIAEKIGFSKSTVNRAKNFFFSIGVIAYKKNAYTSNTYFIDDQVLRINFKKPKWWFTQVNEPVCEPVSIVANNKTIYVHDVPAKAKNIDPKSDSSWPEYLSDTLKASFMKSFDFEKYGFMLKNASNYAIDEAVNDLHWYIKQKTRKPLDAIGACKLLVSRLKKYKTSKSL